MRIALYICLFCATIGIVQILSARIDRQTHVVFCDVGQGDASLIRTGTFDILVDAGPKAHVLECLGKYLPFYDKTLELVMISHPQKDHMEGLLYILDSYTVEAIGLSEADADNELSRSIRQKAKSKRVHVYRLSAGNMLSIPNASIRVLWPGQKYIQNHAVATYTSGNGNRVNVDLNDTSLIFQYVQGIHSVLYTGDASPNILQLFTKQDNLRSEILKVPHHGSKNGLTRNFLLLADPSLSVISVGKNNAYKHPSREILDLFRALNKHFVRTDTVGTYEITFSPDTHK